MVKSKCSKCLSENFELAEVLPRNSKNKVTFIQCESCGTVVGVLDKYNVGLFVHEIAKKLGVNIENT